MYVRRYFVDFIEQEQWVFYVYFCYFLDQFIWYRIDVSTVVIMDFCFIMYVVQCYMDIFMFGGFGNGLIKRGFIYFWWFYQVEDRFFDFVDTVLNCKIFKDSIFYVFQIIMVGIKDFLCLMQVFFDFVTCILRYLYYLVDIIMYYGCFC